MDRSATLFDNRSPAIGLPEASTPGRRERLATLCDRWRLLPLLRRARAGFRHDLRILAYHRIAPLIDADRFDFDVELLSADAEGFRAQMRHLRDSYTPLRFRDVLALRDAGREPPRDAVIVTFDDGYDDNHDVALPILRELGVPATFFISTGHIDSNLPYAFDWVAHAILLAPVGRLQLHQPELGLDLGESRAARRAVVAKVLDRLKALDGRAQQDAMDAISSHCKVGPARPSANSRPMSWGQVRALHAAGMEVGSHGVQHRMLAKLDADGIEHELAVSRDRIAQETGQAPISLAYPVGGVDAYDERVIGIARRLGYRVACSYQPGVNPLVSADWHALRRIAVERDTSAAMFAARLAMPELFGNRPRSARS